MYCLIVLPFLLQYLTNAKDLISSWSVTHIIHWITSMTVCICMHVTTWWWSLRDRTCSSEARLIISINLEVFVVVTVILSLLPFLLVFFLSTSQNFHIHCPDAAFVSLCKGHISVIKVSISLLCTLYIVVLHCFWISLFHNIPSTIWKKVLLHQFPLLNIFHFPKLCNNYNLLVQTLRTDEEISNRLPV
jgi:hypothetical protein